MMTSGCAWITTKFGTTKQQTVFDVVTGEVEVDREENKANIWIQGCQDGSGDPAATPRPHGTTINNKDIYTTINYLLGSHALT